MGQKSPLNYTHKDFYFLGILEIVAFFRGGDFAFTHCTVDM